MAFFFTCGTHTFQSLLQDYENVTVRCANCGNFSGRIYKRWEWFTLCFIPVIPFSIKPDHDVGCHICNFYQDLRFRPDVEQARASGGQGIAMQNLNGPPPGWGQPGPAAPSYGPYYGGGPAGGPPPQAYGAAASIPQYK